MDRRSRGIEVQRAYTSDRLDGSFRVLVDRLWPRGVGKEQVALDEWAKDLAPGSELRKWYGHDPARFEQFARLYRRELRRAPASDVLSRLCAVARRKDVTLVTATRDVEHSGARVLRDVLVERTSNRS